MEPKPLPDRPVAQGNLFVLYRGIGCEDLPQEFGFGMRRLRNWHEAEVFDRLRAVLLAELHAADQID